MFLNSAQFQQELLQWLLSGTLFGWHRTAIDGVVGNKWEDQEKKMMKCPTPTEEKDLSSIAEWRGRRELVVAQGRRGWRSAFTKNQADSRAVERHLAAGTGSNALEVGGASSDGAPDWPEIISRTGHNEGLLQWLIELPSRAVCAPRQCLSKAPICSLETCFVLLPV